jgi:uncharacterized protein YcfL
VVRYSFRISTWISELFSVWQASLQVAFIFTIFSALLLTDGCSSHKETIRGTIQGTVFVVGNEPFTALAVEVSQGKMYRIATSADIRQHLLALQGKKVEVQYSRIDTLAEGITLQLEKFQEVSP